MPRWSALYWKALLESGVDHGAGRQMIFGEWRFGKLLAITVWCACLAHPRAVCQTRYSPVPANIERARDVLTEGFDSGDYTVRVEAITAAGLVGRNETLLTRLGGFLEDNNVQVRLATVHALADVNTPAGRALLRKTLEGDKTPEVSFAAAKALALMEDPEGKAALLEGRTQNQVEPHQGRGTELF
jgi:hypothetical protein